jgi:hypothetical protein
MSHEQWCQQLWDVIKDGGVWAIPRSGLIFVKREKEKQLVLTDAMPHQADMPVTAAELKAQQDSDFDLTVQHFGKIGVAVVRADSK